MKVSLEPVAGGKFEILSGEAERKYTTSKACMVVSGDGSVPRRGSGPNEIQIVEIENVDEYDAAMRRMGLLPFVRLKLTRPTNVDSACVDSACDLEERCQIYMTQEGIANRTEDDE